MPQQQRVGRDESARLFRTSGRVTRSCCPAWCARSLGRERVASTAVLTAGVDDPGITVIIARRALLARPGQRVRHRLTPTTWGITHHPLAYRSHRQHAAPPVLGRGAASPAAPLARQHPCRQPSRWGLRTPPWAPVRAAGSAPAGPAGQASPPGKSAHLGGARRRVACRTSVARQMGRHISDDADQCAAQPPHHRLPGRVLGVPTGSVTVRGENYRGHSPSRLQPAAGRRLSAANLLRPAARGDAPSQPPSGGLRIQPGASAPSALR